MKLLLDTHVYLWVRAAPERIQASERAAIDAADSLLVSAVTLWETALLGGLGRLPSFTADLLRLPSGMALLDIGEEHCRALLALPWLHRDPFDRMLIAQAVVEQVHLMTRDGAIRGYADQVLDLSLAD